jgi:hypothetical protein
MSGTTEPIGDIDFGLKKNIFTGDYVGPSLEGSLAAGITPNPIKNTTPAIGSLPVGTGDNIDFGLKKTDTGNYFNTNIIDNNIGNQNTKGFSAPNITPGIIPISTNNQSAINTPKVTPNTPIGGLPINPVVTPTPTPTPTVTPTVTPDVAPITAPVNTSPGELPGMRRQLNRALGDAKNAAIMRGKPLSQGEIGGMVEGLASGASGRVNAANSLAIANKEIKLRETQLAETQRQFDAQMAETKRQFDAGEINKFEYQRREQELTKWRDEQVNAFNEKQLEMQKYYADQGLALDMDMIKQNEENADTGNILGAAYLLSDLFW